ncbi:MAG: protein kinase [Deltaproteobacteria bacterium]|nr:protein kinase [Deltaproteobacteria bacterium]
MDSDKGSPGGPSGAAGGPVADQATQTVTEGLGACLDMGALAALAEGKTTGAERDRAMAHLDRCDHCRRRFLTLEGVATATAPTRKVGDGADAGIHHTWVGRPGDGVSHPTPLAPGDEVDHFSILKLLGSGGMGEVYLARDSKLGRKVALKVISQAQLHSSRSVDRFMREARTTARLNHPNIVTIHTVGEHGGKPFLALEYIEGQTLRRWMRDNPARAPEEVLHLMLPVAEALAEAHRHGILHRDLKPENVLIGDDGRVRVLDFGLAETVEPEEPPLAEETYEHEKGPNVTGLVGTPRYMAPEQWCELECSGATDVWALGIMLYELLANGEYFFEDAASMLELAAKVCSEEPVTLSERSLRHSPRVRELIARCMQKLPEDRPKAKEMVRVLRRQLRKLEPAAPSSRVPRRRRRWSLVLGGGVLALGAIAAVAVVLDADESAPGDGEGTTADHSATATTEPSASTVTTGGPPSAGTETASAAVSATSSAVPEPSASPPPVATYAGKWPPPVATVVPDRPPPATATPTVSSPPPKPSGLLRTW